MITTNYLHYQKMIMNDLKHYMKKTFLGVYLLREWVFSYFEPNNSPYFDKKFSYFLFHNYINSNLHLNLKF